MVTVAKGLDAPIKLLFPKISNSTAVALNATLANATTTNATSTATNFFGERLDFSMLGLGDIGASLQLFVFTFLQYSRLDACVCACNL